MWITIGLLRVASLLPYRVLIFFGKTLGRLSQALSKSRRRVVDINLQHCFPEKTRVERDKIRNDCFANIGIALFEMAMCWWWSESRLRPLVEIRGGEHIDAVLQTGRGVILLTGHFTSLEIGGRLFTLTRPLQAMYRTQKNRLFDSYLYTRRNSYLAATISRKNTRQLIKGIKNLVPTWYAPDQNFPNEKMSSPRSWVYKPQLFPRVRDWLNPREARCCHFILNVSRMALVTSYGSRHRWKIFPPAMISKMLPR